MRTPKPIEWWEEETLFCEREGCKPNRMGSYREYCTKQANFARADGFPQHAERIAKAAGIGITAETHAIWRTEVPGERVRTTRSRSS